MHIERKETVGGRIILKMDLRDIGWSGIDWIYLGRDKDKWRALVNTINKPLGFIKC
jgi:hypothetical protein